jgi:hypothetical protein
VQTLPALARDLVEAVAGTVETEGALLSLTVPS